MNSLGLNIKRLCSERRWSLSKLSKESGVPLPTLHSWTTGTSPNLAQLKKVSTTLKTSIHQLAYGEPDPHETNAEILHELFSGDVRVTLHKIEKKGR